jgi:hypothetical protein
MLIYWLVSIAALALAVNAIAATVMKLGVNHSVQSKEKLSWWSRRYGKIERKHRELYPDSYLPLVAQWSFWLAVAMFAIFVVASATRRLG